MPVCVRLLLLLCAAALAPPAGAGDECSRSNRGTERMESARIVLVNPRGERVELTALIADDPLERAAGYQYICPEVIARTHILFRYDAPNAGRFHMRNVKAPLDIGFFDARGVLMQSMLMRTYAPSGEEILYAPMQPFQYALESRAGFFRDRGLAAGGSRLLLDSLP